MFLELLTQYRIELVCDVRSIARSRWAHFNGKVLARELVKPNIGYEQLPECGGKVVVPPPELASGVERIMELADDARIALMCSESQPLTRHITPQANCHRVGLLSSPPLKRRGARIRHILPKGELLELDETSVPSIWDGRAV